MDLEEEFKDVNVEDPTSMDKVLILLESIQAEDDEFMEVPDIFITLIVILYTTTKTNYV